MKKSFLGLVALSVVTFSSIEAKTNYNVAAIVEVSDEKETPAKAEELPEAVKKTLAGEAYANWQISAAFLVTGTEAEYYKIELTKGEEKQVVKLDKEGTVIK